MIHLAVTSQQKMSVTLRVAQKHTPTVTKAMFRRCIRYFQLAYSLQLTGAAKFQISACNQLFCHFYFSDTVLLILIVLGSVLLFRGYFANFIYQLEFSQFQLMFFSFRQDYITANCPSLNQHFPNLTFLTFPSNQCFATLAFLKFYLQVCNQLFFTFWLAF